MRRWQLWWHTLIQASQNNPPQFIEFWMLVLAIALLLIWESTDQAWDSDYSWPYLVLSLSYAMGAAVSALVREAMIPSQHHRLTQVTAVLLLLVSFYSFTDLVRYF